MKDIYYKCVTRGAAFSLFWGLLATLWAAQSAAAPYIPRSEVRLPEERYVLLKSERTEIIAGYSCKTPVTEEEDTWKTIRDKKASELEQVMREQDECDEFEVGSEGIACIDSEKGLCLAYGPLVRSGEEKCHTVGKQEREVCHTLMDRACLEYGSPIEEVIFSVEYRKMFNIHQGEGLFDDDNVIIGKESIDFKNVTSANRAAALLEDLRYISVAMKEDTQVYLKPGWVPSKCEALKPTLPTEQEKKKKADEINTHRSQIRREVTSCVKQEDSLKIGPCIERLMGKYGLESSNIVPW